MSPLGRMVFPRAPLSGENHPPLGKHSVMLPTLAWHICIMLPPLGYHVCYLSYSRFDKIFVILYLNCNVILVFCYPTDMSNFYYNWDVIFVKCYPNGMAYFDYAAQVEFSHDILEHMTYVPK